MKYRVHRFDTLGLTAPHVDFLLIVEKEIVGWVGGVMPGNQASVTGAI